VQSWQWWLLKHTRVGKQVEDIRQTCRPKAVVRTCSSQVMCLSAPRW
jgi:hypothetical protein